ncbi:aldehyde dehydrogenase family protein, partial [Amaricoccus sp.]|uniref:aldehyde dehydrogenase family protein n=1 Tax=Amaricoccus sp. TaxID=1872485 RepID=UPI002BD8928B
MAGPGAMEEIRCISPVDGSLYAARPVEPIEHVRARLGPAREAQARWAARPLAERIALVREGVARLVAMNDAIVPELAWQMGRPVRYGGEMGGGRERTAYMAESAAASLAPTMIEDSDR